MITLRSRENVQTQGRRYLVEGRLRVTLVHAGRVQATCRGQGDLYQLMYAGGGWWCSCPALSLCAHLVALQLVVVGDKG